MPEAGWYRDPQDPSVDEYWDGQRWTGHRRPTGGQVHGYPGHDQQIAPAQHVWGQRPHWPGVPVGAGPSHHHRTRLLIGVGIVVVVLVAAGLVTFLLRSGNSPAITYRGKAVASPSRPLAAAEKAVDALVSRDHGAKNKNTRCYYARPMTPAHGARRTDVLDSLRCGPVLFVDGNAAREYLSIPLRARTSGGQTRLTPVTSGLNAGSPAAVPGSLTLLRPDGATPAAGSGGLGVPAPPAAVANSIVSAVLRHSDTPSTLHDAAMISRDQGITLDAAGEVPRYGNGLDARSAPAGQHLIAFRLTSGHGAVGSGGTIAPTLVLDGTSHLIPPTHGDEWDVAAVPSASSPVIRFVADGFTQTLSLPGGKPGSGDIAVLQRANTVGKIERHINMTSVFTSKGRSLTGKLTVSIDTADLYFWSPLHPDSHPSDARSAYLSIDMTYKDSKQPGKTLGFDPGLLRLQLPGGGALAAHNLAGPGDVYNVFTVPAGFTSGTLIIGGSTNIGHGTRQKVTPTTRVAIRIPTG